MTLNRSTDVTRELDKVWALCVSRGIDDNIVIIELIAKTMLAYLKLHVDGNIPAIDWDREDPMFQEITKLIKEAVKKAGSEAVFFDQHVLFYPKLRPVAGRFPTPRHIVRMMRHLVQIQDDHTLCDLACGSGGCLVAREGEETWSRKIVGIERSPQWAYLARANIVLHKITCDKEVDVDIRAGDAFNICSSGDLLYNQRFDRMLLAPSFGEKVDPALASEVVGYDVGSDSATALTALTLYMLAEAGRAVILVPQSLLSNDDAARVNLRKRIVGTYGEQGNWSGDYDVEGVISLPREALQPFSPLQTYMLVVSKRAADQPPQQKKNVWFFLAEFDGYPAGNRNSMLRIQIPDTPNDLTFVEAVMLAHDHYLKDDQKPLIEGVPSLSAKEISRGDTRLGIIVEASNGGTLSHVEYYSREGQSSGCFLVEVAYTASKQAPQYMTIVLDQTFHVDTGSDRVSLLRKVYRADNFPSSVELLQGSKHVQAVAISNKKGILGVAISPQGIIYRDRPYVLEPSEYVKKSLLPTDIEPAAVLLGKLRRNQYSFLQQIDGLMGRLELTPVVGHELPSPILKEVEPLKGISKDQENVWRRICQVSELHKKTLNGLFTFEDVRDPNEGDESTRLTLSLLERMGVIVPVTIVDPRKRSSLSTTFYRRVTIRDLWSGESDRQ